VQNWTDFHLRLRYKASLPPSEIDSRTHPKVDGRTNMITEGTKNFSPAYSALFDKPVVLLVVIRQCHVPMPCRIVSESAADVRVRIQPGWEMDVRKDLILAVEEIVNAAEDQVN
jgi:hypothetical protein